MKSSGNEVRIRTSAYSAFNRGDERLRPWFHLDNGIVLPLVVVGELRAGFAAGNWQKENDDLLERFMDSPSVNVVTITEMTTRVFAEIYLRLRRAGKSIGTNDMWIAAIALEQDLSLLTLDDDFSHVPDLMVAHL
jgi:tRNA(fMet)-specific endonuclease VapC